MTWEVNFYCDLCKKPLHPNDGCCTINVRAIQNPIEDFDKAWENRESLESEYWTYDLCKDCVGSKVSVRKDSGHFNIKDGCKNLLKRLGFFKTELKK